MMMAAMVCCLCGVMVLASCGDDDDNSTTTETVEPDYWELKVYMATRSNLTDETPKALTYTLNYPDYNGGATATQVTKTGLEKDGNTLIEDGVLGKIYGNVVTIKSTRFENQTEEVVFTLDSVANYVRPDNGSLCVGIGYEYVAVDKKGYPIAGNTNLKRFECANNNFVSESWNEFVGFLQGAYNTKYTIKVGADGKITVTTSRLK